MLESMTAVQAFGLTFFLGITHFVALMVGMIIGTSSGERENEERLRRYYNLSRKPKSQLLKEYGKED